MNTRDNEPIFTSDPNTKEVIGLRSDINPDKVNWKFACRELKLSEDFIRTHKERVSWDRVSKFQTLSEDFIREFLGRLSIRDILRNREISHEFITEFNDIIQLTESTYYGFDWGLYEIRMNMLEKYQDVLDSLYIGVEKIGIAFKIVFLVNAFKPIEFYVKLHDFNLPHSAEWEYADEFIISITKYIKELAHSILDYVRETGNIDDNYYISNKDIIHPRLKTSGTKGVSWKSMGRDYLPTTEQLIAEQEILDKNYITYHNNSEAIISSRDRYVLFIMKSRINMKTFTTMDLSDIASELDCSIKSVRKSIKRLEKAGFLETGYRLTDKDINRWRYI